MCEHRPNRADRPGAVLGRIQEVCKMFSTCFACGVVVSVKVKNGDKIKEGDTVATLSAMKMETSIPATCSGTVTRVTVNVGDKVEGDDLLVEIEEDELSP